MKKLYSFNDLQADHDGGLEGKVFASLCENFLQALPEQIHDHHHISILHAGRINFRNALKRAVAVQILVQLSLEYQLGVPC